MKFFPNNPVVALVTGTAAIVLAVAVLYGHTLQVPFYLDDIRGIAENSLLRDLPAAFARLFSQRGLTSLSFALNYRMTGFSLPSLHLVNIVLHAGCGLLVWRLLQRLLRGFWPPLLGALLFVAHPLQTQAVTYLIQRATLLGALFFLLAVLLYLRSREALAAGAGFGSCAHLLPYLGAVLAGGCAVLAKENTVTLPLLLLACERLYPVPGRSGWRPALLACLPFCIVPLLLGGSVLVSLIDAGEANRFFYPIASLRHNSPSHYLVTEFSVIWVYLRLLVLPFGQALEHNYPVVAQLFSLQSLVALAGLLAVGWGAWRVRRSQPALTFGVVWFFLGLAVESSIIPLDPLFEHRLYLPMVGFALVLLAGLPTLLGERHTALVLGLALLACAPLTWQRNALWREPVAFYEDNLRVAPDSERLVKSLALLYYRAGRADEALQLLERSVAAYPDGYLLYGELAKIYAVRGRGEEGLALLEKGMNAFPGYTALYEEAAAICKENGTLPRALGYLRRGLAAQAVDRGRLTNALGLYSSDAGASREAEAAFLAALELPGGDGDKAQVHMNLAREYYYREDWPRAFAELRMVVQLSPGDGEALERLAELALRTGDLEVARQAVSKLEFVDRDAWRRLQGAIAAANAGARR